jgi:hypothetical protein
MDLACNGSNVDQPLYRPDLEGRESRGSAGVTPKAIELATTILYSVHALRQDTAVAIDTAICRKPLVNINVNARKQGPGCQWNQWSKRG